MRTVGMIVGGLIGVVLLGGGGAYLWASSTAQAKLSATWEAHERDVPLPWPLSEEALEALRTERRAALQAAWEAKLATGELVDEAAAAAALAAHEAQLAAPLDGLDLDALALERSVARGEHLVQARYACVECHGTDFSGGVMIDDPAIGTLLGPNLTGGAGSPVADYTMVDWERAIRQGVLRDGTGSMMPCEDYQRMSNQELSDVVAYIQTFPAIDGEVPKPTLGPIGTFLVATDTLTVAPATVDPDAVHADLPPSPDDPLAFGEHLAGVCTGCHRAGLEGGPMPFGPPDWPPARNLTPSEDGMAGWTEAQFVAAMRDGVRPDGTALREPMVLMTRYAQEMTDQELSALFAYLQSLPATPTGT